MYCFSIFTCSVAVLWFCFITIILLLFFCFRHEKCIWNRTSWPHRNWAEYEIISWREVQLDGSPYYSSNQKVKFIAAVCCHVLFSFFFFSLVLKVYISCLLFQKKTQWNWCLYCSVHGEIERENDLFLGLWKRERIQLRDEEFSVIQLNLYNSRTTAWQSSRQCTAALHNMLWYSVHSM